MGPDFDIKGKIKIVNYPCISKIISVLCVVCLPIENQSAEINQQDKDKR